MHSMRRLSRLSFPRQERNPICTTCVLNRLFTTASKATAQAQISTPQASSRTNIRSGKPVQVSRSSSVDSSRPKYDCSKWEVTVGLEIHAQLNAKRKLFSYAKTSFNATPNTHVAMFDAAIPGTQPKLNLPTILPALRAAVALKCHINQRSSFDRKHYFYKDQPCGYQITQFYEALANDGHVILTDRDGLTVSEGGDTMAVVVGIKQVQLEQDTAKSLYLVSGEPGIPSRTLIDLNRAASPLIEIITTPSLHSSHDAAVCLRKIQGILKYSQAAIEGMERGGVRCDVNVSIRQYGDPQLGQRVEIKNLNSIKAVQDSIDAEVLRQIKVLESGGAVEGETRGWDILKGESKKLRGKEGEVDYRYMPDAEIPALVLDESLIEYIRYTMPKLPEQILDELITEPYALTSKDARSLMALDEGARVAYYLDVVQRLDQALHNTEHNKHIGKLVGNWILHELGGWLSAKSIPWELNPVTSQNLVDILTRLCNNRLTGANAKYLLDLLTEEEHTTSNVSIEDLIAEHNLATEERSLGQTQELTTMAEKLVTENEAKAQLIRSGKKVGLMNFFVGQMMRDTGGKVDVDVCKKVMQSVIFPERK